MAVFEKVLFVDDDPIMVKITERIMQLLDFSNQFISKKDGLQAKDYLVNNIDGLPDIIFVDLHMNVMNGWKFIEWFKEWCLSAGVKIPLYVLSSGLNEDGASLDAIDGYLMKPLTAENLSHISGKHSVKNI
jgi:CheY-like chemotaxis protein